MSSLLFVHDEMVVKGNTKDIPYKLICVVDLPGERK